MSPTYPYMVRKFHLAQNLGYATTYFFVSSGSASTHELEKGNHGSILKTLASILGLRRQKNKLKEYHWWNVYCDRLERGEPVEGNFFVARLFQEEAAAVDNEVTGNDIVFSVPENTRAKTQERERLEQLKAAQEDVITSASNTNPRHEIWVIFAVHGQKYLRFLSGDVISPDDPESFSTMYEVGPFDTTRADHMRNFGPLVLALALRADHDREREREDAEREQAEEAETGEDSEIDTESSEDPLAA